MNREAVYEQLKIDEGVVYEIYLDHLGYKTFGVGHLVLESDPEHAYEVGEPVSVERVIECFNRDLDVAVSECVALYGADIWEGFPGEVQEVLVEYAIQRRPSTSLEVQEDERTPRSRRLGSCSYRRARLLMVQPSREPCRKTHDKT